MSDSTQQSTITDHTLHSKLLATTLWKLWKSCNAVQTN